MKYIILILTFISTGALSSVWDEPVKKTSVGPDLNRAYDASEPAIAVNQNESKYLIVWEGNDNASGLAADEVEIFGKMFHSNGTAITPEAYRISFTGASLSNIYDARQPEVVYNPDVNEFVVVWYADDNKNGLVEGEFEIFAQRLNGSDGSLIGEAVRVSDMGPNSNRSYDAFNPHIAYNSVDGLYLVVWHGEEGNAASPLGSFEIYGQLLNASLNEVGGNDFLISDMGPDNNPDYNAYSPVAAYNSTDNEFLVVWYGEDDRDGRVPGEFEIYARRINANTGTMVDNQSISVSYVGLNGDPARAAKFPDVVYNPDLNEYLIVWSADDSKDGHVGNEFEIYGQVLDSNGVETGKNDFIISEMGPLGANSFDAFRPKLEYSPKKKQYAVVWRGDDLVDGEFEIYAQRIDASSQIRIGETSERLSYAGVEGSLLYDARRVDIGYDSVQDIFFAVWEQEDDSAVQTEGEFEIFGSQLNISDFTITSGQTGSWFNPDRSGEGYILEILPDNSVLMVWFTYLPNIADQAWLLGVGSIQDEKLIFKDVVITSGGIFGDLFNPDLVQQDIWGDVSFEFDDCGQGIMNYQSAEPDYQNGFQFVSRLTNVSGVECDSSAQNTDSNNTLSGAWYDPSHNGEGWLIEYLGNNQVLLYWFSYDNTGNQKWMLSVGEIGGDNIIRFNDVTITDGTYFGSGFNANDVNLLPWGTMQMEMNGCDTMSVSYDSGIGIFGAGQLNARKLTNIDGLQCD